MADAESALVVLVPEAETLLRWFRARYDPGTPIDAPAHITLIYPFKPPDAIGPAVLDGLRGCCRHFAPFDFALTRLRYFPDAAYLTPEPEEPFRSMTMAIWERFPETAPYGGKYATIVPHLTVARVADTHRLAAIAEDFAVAAVGKIPIRAHAVAVSLMDTRSGRWEVIATFALG